MARHLPTRPSPVKATLRHSGVLNKRWCQKMVTSRSSTGDNHFIFLKWQRRGTARIPDITLILSGVALLPFSSAFRRLDQFQGAAMAPLRRKTGGNDLWGREKKIVSAGVFVQVMRMEESSLHIHWSNSSRAAAAMVASYHSGPSLRYRRELKMQHLPCRWKTEQTETLLKAALKLGGKVTLSSFWYYSFLIRITD